MAECRRVDDRDDGGVDDSPEPPQGGYCNVDFIDPPDSLQCPICLSTLKQPHILSCCSSHMCEVSTISFLVTIISKLYRTVLDVFKLVDSHVLVVERKIICIFWTREQEARC